MPTDLLRRHPLPALLDSADRDRWLGLGVERACQSGEQLCATGSPGAFAFLVLDGSVRVVRPSRFRGEVTLGKLGPGQLFGEYALVPPHRNTATCRVSGPARILQLPLEPLRDALARFPSVLPNLKSWVRLHALTAHLRGQSFLGFHAADGVAAWDAVLVEHALEPGMTVQAPGLADDRWFYLDQGEILLRDRSGTRRLGPGDCFGESALADLPGVGYAESLTTVRCRALAAADFTSGQSTRHRFQTTGANFDHNTLAGFWVPQQQPTECGLAALAMILRSRRFAASLSDLRPLARLSPAGLNLAQLARVASLLHLPCVAVIVAADRLADVTLPAIAHLRDGHFVAVFECRPNKVLVGDPARGIQALDWSTWRERFSGNLLLFPELGLDPRGLVAGEGPSCETRL